MDLKGKVVVFTGSLSLMTRNEAREKAVKMGAILSDTVSRQTDYLIVGDKPGAKLTKAIMISVKIIREQDWYKFCDDSYVFPERKLIPFREVSAPELDLD